MSTSRSFYILLSLIALKFLLSIIEFPFHFGLQLARSTLFLIILVLALYFFDSWKHKLLSVLILFLITYIQIYSQPYRLSASFYISNFEAKNQKVIKDVQELEGVGIINNYMSAQYENRIFSKSYDSIDKVQLKSLFENSDVVQIYKQDCISLFVLSRFIDNGYGFAWLESNCKYSRDDFYQIRIHGLEVRSMRLIKDSWYFVSFT